MSAPAKDRRPPPTTGQSSEPGRGKTWLSAFAVRGGRIVLRKTGNSAAIDRRLIAEVLVWLGYIAIVYARFAWRRARGERRRIWFAPDVPRPWYLVRAAALWAGIAVAREPGTAAAAFYFEDATTADPLASPHPRGFNFGCNDIAKSRVAAVFASIFGYPLAIDPLTHAGPALEKSDANGTHDGRVVACPAAPANGKVYQRLIDTVDGVFAHEYRTHCVGGEIVAVWRKQRRAAERFLPPNVAASSLAPGTVFDAAERAAIARFCRAMGADWAGLDILRDRAEGRIYIVDVNKTDAGPIIALPLREKLTATATLAAALSRLIDGGA